MFAEGPKTTTGTEAPGQNTGGFPPFNTATYPSQIFWLTVTFVALLVRGSCTDRGTEGRAAWWQTISVPRTALCTRS